MFKKLKLPVSQLCTTRQLLIVAGLLFGLLVIATISLNLPKTQETRVRAANVTLLDDQFNSSSIDGSKWGISFGGGSSITEGGGVATLSIPAAGNAYADLYSISSFPVGSTFVARVYITAGQTCDHKGIGFANARVDADVNHGETEAAIWRGQDTDKYTETKTGGLSPTAYVPQYNYPAAWSTFTIVRVSSSQALFYENGNLLATHTSNIPTGSLPVRFSGYTYIGNCGQAPITIQVDSVTVTGPAPPPPTVWIKANGSGGSTTIAYNTAANLTWGSTNANGCTASNGWSGSKPAGGSEPTGNLTASKTYTLICSGLGGSSPPGSVTVNVSPPPSNAVTADIKANGSNGPVYINSGSSATISWSSNNASSCKVSPDGWTGTSGSKSSGGLTSAKTYTLNCSGTAGSASDSVKVNIGTPPKPESKILESLQLDLSVGYLVSTMKLKMEVSGVKKEVEVSGNKKDYGLDLKDANLALNKEYSLIITSDKTLVKKVRFTPTASSFNVDAGNLILGDLNQDNKIDSKDQLELIKSISAQTAVGDLNADKDTDSLDWAILLTNFGKKGD